MKKFWLAWAGLLLLAGCATQGINIAYELPQEKKLEWRQVYLEVKDVRTVKEILSPRVRKMELLSGVGGVVNLVTRAARGEPKELKRAEVRQAFERAFGLRFADAGLGLASEPGPEQESLTIEVERLWLDLVESTFKAEVSYLAKFARGSKIYHQERVSGRSEKYNLLGDKTGEATLSEAFSMAVNSLDLGYLSK